MIRMEMPDGSDVQCEVTGVDRAALREFVMRFMSQSANWDVSGWDWTALADAFELRFGQPVIVQGRDREDGTTSVAIRSVAAREVGLRTAVSG